MPAILGSNNYSIMDDRSSFFNNITIKSGGSLNIGVFPYAGANTGYITGGLSAPTTTFTGVQRFPFASDTISSGGSVISRRFHSGHSSSTEGYYSFGSVPGISTSIQKFPFSAGTLVAGNISTVGTFPTFGVEGAGGTSSELNGYVVGGATSPGAIVQRIFRFSFYGDTTLSGTIGSLQIPQAYFSGFSSTSHGYTAGGQTASPGITSTIQKFAFVPEGDSTTVGNLAVARSNAAAASSPTSGYTAGGTEPSFSNSVDKFPFASDAPATLLGNLGAGKRANLSGLSSVTKGYFAGGVDSGGTRSTALEAFTYSNDTSYSTVGTLGTAVSAAASHQF